MYWSNIWECQKRDKRKLSSHSQTLKEPSVNTLHSGGHTPQNCCLTNHKIVQEHPFLCFFRVIAVQMHDHTGWKTLGKKLLWANHYVSTIWKGDLPYINPNESFECWVFLKTRFMWSNGVEIYINWQSGSRSLRHERLMGSRGLKLCMHFAQTGGRRRSWKENQEEKILRFKLIFTSLFLLWATPGLFPLLSEMHSCTCTWHILWYIAQMSHKILFPPVPTYS